jgi:putative ABC transport system permease protein
MARRPTYAMLKSRWLTFKNRDLFMILIYLKSIGRGLLKNRSYSFLNITGLTAGLVCFVFIALWVNDEISYDKFNHNYDRIVRLTGVAKMETGVIESAKSAVPMAKALLNDFAEVENTVRIRRKEEIVMHNNQQWLQPGILLADPSLFHVFSYHLIRGNAATALNEPYSIILTESTAKKYFGNSDPMDQTLTINLYDSSGRGAPYKITGIMADPPSNAHFTFNMVASFKTIEAADPDVLTAEAWAEANIYTYLLLKKDVEAKAFSKKIAQFYAKYVGDRFTEWRKIYSYKLQPLSEIHLHSRLESEMAGNGNARDVYIFFTIGVFILLMAGINYMNLATAHSVNKAKEVGVKKVVGAVRNQLIVQYLLEAVMLAVIALLFALLLCTLLQPAFFQITGKEISLFASPLLIIFLISVTILLGIVSGIYPAFIISGFKPIVVLKGSFKSGNRAVLLRKILVVSQFVITLLLISCIVVIYSQMSYIKNKDLGYNKHGLLLLRLNGNIDVVNGYSAFKNDLLANPLVSGVAVSNSISGIRETGSVETVDRNGNKLQVKTASVSVDTAYLDVYGIKLIVGRNFDNNSGTDSIVPFILNEFAIHKFGWNDPALAIGKPFKMDGRQGKIIGVVRDFHFSTLQNLIEPLALYPVGGYFSRIILRTDISNPSNVTALLQKTWKHHFPSILLDYDFADDQLAEQYRLETRFAKIFLYFSVLSLIIACLGLYGLISYTTSQKTKEIGVRKVLGATATAISIMLSKDFLKLVILAFVITTPVAWLVMNIWLQDFAYRVNLSWWMFASAGVIVVLLALMTVSFRVFNAATVNPVKSLRVE